jgi:hypothetical protein
MWICTGKCRSCVFCLWCCASVWKAEGGFTSSSSSLYSVFPLSWSGQLQIAEFCFNCENVGLLGRLVRVSFTIIQLRALPCRFWKARKRHGKFLRQLWIICQPQKLCGRYGVVILGIEQFYFEIFLLFISIYQRHFIIVICLSMKAGVLIEPLGCMILGLWVDFCLVVRYLFDGSLLQHSHITTSVLVSTVRNNYSWLNKELLDFMNKFQSNSFMQS